MTQKTNEPVDVVDVEFDEADFADDVDFEDDADDLTDAPDSDDIDDESDNAPAPAPSKKQLEIKYNGNKEVFDLETQQDQVVELLQKGRNYDHVKTELESLKNSEETQMLKALAKEAGFENVKEFLQKVNQDIESRKVESRVQELVAQGVPKDIAQHTAKLELNKPAPPVTDEVAEVRKSFQELLSQYPETANYKSLSDFPSDVIDALNQGVTPLVAYQKHLLNKERAERERLEHIAKVKNRDIGSLTSTKDEEEDPFLAELLK